MYERVSSSWLDALSPRQCCSVFFHMLAYYMSAHTPIAVASHQDDDPSATQPYPDCMIFSEETEELPLPLMQHQETTHAGTSFSTQSHTWTDVSLLHDPS
jgi:hypothetical protein